MSDFKKKIIEHKLVFSKEVESFSDRVTILLSKGFVLYGELKVVPLYREAEYLVAFSRELVKYEENVEC